MVWLPFVAGAGLLVFAGASFFFALAETALFSLGQWQARQLAGRAPRGGALVARLLAEPQDLLATIVLGNTLANGALVALALWMALRGDWPLWPTLFGLLAVILVGGEVAPKALAVRAPEQWALRIAAPMVWLQRITRPARQVAQRLNALILRGVAARSGRPQTTLSDEEYRELLELACQQGTLATHEKEIILQIIRLDRRTARDVMKPRSRLTCLSDDCSIEEMITIARRSRHRRLLMYDETPDTIVGVLNTRALLLDPQQDLSEAVEFPSFVPASMNLLQLLQSLQRQQRGLAIVLDEFGGTAGIVTVQDILEEIVGDLRAEGEAVGFVMEKLEAGRWRVNGTMRVDDFRREYPELGEVDDVDTLGGLLVAQLEVVPQAGESVLFRGLRLTAAVADARRVREVLVEVVRRKGGD